ncbi:MgtC/SapB family protein [Aestuariivirga sp.]|uniref:MgtC/SapB family protein n=1 Tax=Aestuariivirga sp. TaxID=2650926 RepID=UPI003919BF6D
METSELATRLGLALALGFVIGLERGWKERDEGEGRRAAGLRTFSLIGMLGGVFGLLSLGGDRLLISAGFITTSLVLAFFIWREHEREGDYSATTLVAALLTFVLGALAVLGNMAVAAGAGVATVGLLAYKTQLHGFLARITWDELRSGLLLAAMTFIALPLLPDRALDPWDALNPHDLWLVTILIAAVSFAGYVAVKLIGPSRGIVLSAAVGGLVSSTVVTLSLARLARANAGRVQLLTGGILASGGVMMARVLVLAGALNLSLAAALAIPLIAAALFQLLAALLLIGREARAGGEKPEELVHRNPFLLSEVLRFGAILAAVMLAAAVAQSIYGDGGLMAVAAISGLADVDALTLSVANMGPATAVGVAAVLLTIGVNNIAKSVYGWVAGGTRLGLLLLAFNLAAMAVAVAAYYLLPSLPLQSLATP